MYIYIYFFNTKKFKLKLQNFLFIFLLLYCYIISASQAYSAEVDPGITDTYIRIGAIMPLTGDNDYYGIHMKKGIDAALANQIVQGRKIEFEVMDDSSDPITTIQAANQLIDKGVFLMLGNIGALQTLELMPVLKANQIPSVGFYTLGDVNTNDTLNYRPQTTDEVATLVTVVTNTGIKPDQICIFAQNDVFGVAAINGFKNGLKGFPQTQTIIDKLDHILDMTMNGINPAPNNLGPIGFYPHETILIRDGYLSLKEWGRKSGKPCRFVILVAVPKVAADFIAYSRHKNETWHFGAISATAAGYALSKHLSNYSINDEIIVTQVVPDLDASLPIVRDARNSLENDFNHVNLEGYIAGRLFLAILKSMKEPITRDNFIKTAYQKPLELGGLKIEFNQENSSGYKLISLNILEKNTYKPFVINDSSIARKQ
ncbi:MAG: ABC transporter substrate-binding protein [Gammaproteobacteria bacterium]|nr:ABC transporter substrate-binding protein [Gammaproteobacteria bacterium]